MITVFVSDHTQAIEGLIASQPGLFLPKSSSIVLHSSSLSTCFTPMGSAAAGGPGVNLYCRHTKKTTTDVWMMNANGTKFNGQGASKRFYRQITGTVDKLTGQIHFTVRRSSLADKSKVLSEEKFTGRYVVFTVYLHL